jgi:ABC-type transport system substrate-binding protein
MLAIMFVSIIGVIPTIPTVYAQETCGPKCDKVIHKVIKSPDDAVFAMQTGIADVYTDLMRTADIKTLDADGCTITQNLGFHIGFIAYNIRDTETIQAYYRPEISYWPLHDVQFRHALVHCYNQLSIVPEIYGYIITPVRSLVPPSQSKYYNANVPMHPYNPGDPFTSPAGEHSTCGILKGADYTFEDADSSGTVTDADYWKCPDGSPMPYLEIWTPFSEVNPTSYEHGAQFVADLGEEGLAATIANGNHGFQNMGRDFNEYLSDVYDEAAFDAFMVFYSLGRMPSQLYLWLHSRQDSKIYCGRRNAVGVNDPQIDADCETVKYSLDLDAVEAAAKEVQEMLYTPDLPNADNFALSYMTLCSRSYFNAFTSDVTGIVKSPGYGSDNMWTWLNIDNPAHTIVYINGDESDSFNPCCADTEYEWNIIALTQDGMTEVNPYNHRDIPWLASEWTITPTVAGMDIDFTLNDTISWQDGRPFTAYDVEFCLEFLRDYHVPRYAYCWETLIDVEVIDATHCTIHADQAGIDLFYDYAGVAAMLPQHIWDRAWADDQAVLDYDPTEAYNVASGYTAGSHPPATNLFGTGSFIFQWYDAVNMVCEMDANRNYFLSQTEIDDIKTEMFWEVGDVNRDGIINVIDLTIVSRRFGCFVGDPCYDPDADFNSDCIIDFRDIANIAFHLLWQKVYP